MRKLSAFLVYAVGLATLSLLGLQVGKAIASAPSPQPVLGAVSLRPNNVTALLTILNGQPIRFQLPDGGPSGMYGSGEQCMAVTPGLIYKLTPPSPIYLCTPSPTAGNGASGTTWDGGCNSTAADMNMGDYIGANVEHYVNTKDCTTICQVPASGSVNTPVFLMQ